MAVQSWQLAMQRRTLIPLLAIAVVLHWAVLQLVQPVMAWMDTEHLATAMVSISLGPKIWQRSQ